MKHLKLNDIVLVTELKNIGLIIDLGSDSLGVWYRTDCDGVRERHELIHIKNTKELTESIEAGNNIAPSVINKITETFVY